jgi:hypothetical protein
MRTPFWAIVLLAAFQCQQLPAQADLDDVFQSPDPDVTTTESDQADTVDSILSQPAFQVRGSYTATLGALAGWDNLPDFGNLATGFSISPVLGVSSSLTIDARPDSNFRVNATVDAAYPDPGPPPIVADFTPITLRELFCDLSFAEIIFIRVGKQVVTWGASHLFPVGNLPSRIPVAFQSTSETYDSAAGVGVKASIPLGVHSLSFLAQIKDGYVQNATNPGLGEVGYGALCEFVLGKSEIALGGYYQQYLRPRTIAILKTSVWGIDASAEVILAFPNDQPPMVSGVTDLFWEQPDVRFSVLVEALYNAESSQADVYPQGPTIAIVAGFKDIARSKVDAGIQWEHDFLDNSGMVSAGIVYSPFAHVRVISGIPVYYGLQPGQIGSLNPDPVGRRTAIGVKLEIAGSF